MINDHEQQPFKQTGTTDMAAQHGTYATVSQMRLTNTTDGQNTRKINTTDGLTCMKDRHVGKRTYTFDEHKQCRERGGTWTQLKYW